MQALSDSQTQEIKEVIDQLEAELRATLEDARNSASVVELDQTRIGRVSRGDAMQQQEMAAAGLRGVEKRLQGLRAARVRLEAGDYGWCGECDEPIAFGRLQRQPEARYCIACQSARE